MTFDITKKRALETGQIDLVTGEGSPLIDENGNQLSVTVYGPGSKIWQVADATRNRRRLSRIEKNRGRASAALDQAREDEIDFLVAVTISFNGWEYPAPENQPWPDQNAMFRAAYADDTLGYIRDHVSREANSWEAFTKGSATS